jgi:hypothetical protein
VTGIDLKIEVVRQRRSQYEVARTAGLEPTRLNHILNGWLEPRPDELSAISAALNLNQSADNSESSGE